MKKYKILLPAAAFLKDNYRISYEYKQSEKETYCLVLGFYKKDSASVEETGQ